MSKMIQIRNVPDQIHRILKIRSVEEGLSLSDYLLKEVTGIAKRPTIKTVSESIRKKPPVKITETSFEAVREEREGRQ